MVDEGKNRKLRPEEVAQRRDMGSDRTCVEAGSQQPGPQRTPARPCFFDSYSIPGARGLLMAGITAPVWTLAQRICTFSPMGNQSHLGKTVACVAGARSVQSQRTLYRFDLGESTSPCCRSSKKNGSWQALGRSRGGLNTKIHALSSNPYAFLRICLTGGEVHDSQAFQAVYCHLQQMTHVESVSADRAYDSDAIRNSIHDQAHQCVIPSKSNRREPIAFDRQKYKNRNCIERAFRNLKNFRRIATRYDKLAATFKAFIYFASSLLFAKIVNTA